MPRRTIRVRPIMSLSSVASAALERRSQTVSSMGLRVDEKRDPRAWVRGSETLLARLVENLVDNAVTHNRPGGWVRVEIKADAPDVFLVVENGGALLEQEEVDGLARPFRRLGADRTGSDEGTGLGLAIVKSISEAHGGAPGLYARADGGLRAVVTLPLAVSDAVGAAT